MAFDFSELKSKFDQVLTIVGDDLKTIKTGRAKPALVEDIQAEAYGARMPLKELASITAPDPQLIVIQPWDQSVVEAIEKALQQNQFNPSVDGQMIRINIPQLTGEKREEMVKQVHQKIESGRQMLRSERTEGKKKIEAQKGEAGISEDDVEADLEKLEELTKEYMDKLDTVAQSKEEELRTI